MHKNHNQKGKVKKAMFSSNNKISVRQLQILIMCNTLGIGIIILPKIFFGFSMLNMILLLFFILAAVYLITRVTQNYDGDNFFSYTQRIFGTTAAKIFSVMLMIKIFITTALQLKLFSQIIKIYVLPKTPSYIVNLVLIITAGYLVSKGYETRARLSEILIWLIILPLAIVFFITVFDIKNIPYGNTNINLARTFEGIFIFSQLDYLFLCEPFIKKSSPKKIFEAIIFSWLAIFFLMCIIKMKIQYETFFPIIKLMTITDIPGGFVQNQDFFIISFVIITFFVLISSGIFFSSELFACINEKHKILICCAIIYFICFINQNISCKIIYILGTFFYFVFPLIILITNKKAGDKN